MSRGRQRHQASRRRMYSARQRELRERRMQATRDERYWPTDHAAIEVEHGLDFEAQTAFSLRLPDRASAA